MWRVVYRQPFYLLLLVSFFGFFTAGCQTELTSDIICKNESGRKAKAIASLVDW